MFLLLAVTREPATFGSSLRSWLYESTGIIPRTRYLLNGSTAATRRVAFTYYGMMGWDSATVRS